MGIFHSPNCSQKWRWFGLTNPFSLQKFSSPTKVFPQKSLGKIWRLKSWFGKCCVSFFVQEQQPSRKKIGRPNHRKPQPKSLTVFPLTVLETSKIYSTLHSSLYPSLILKKMKRIHDIEALLVPTMFSWGILKNYGACNKKCWKPAARHRWWRCEVIHHPWCSSDQVKRKRSCRLLSPDEIDGLFIYFGSKCWVVDKNPNCFEVSSSIPMIFSMHLKVVVFSPKFLKHAAVWEQFLELRML